MASVDAAVVLLSRPTTLIGQTSFSTQPLDVSLFGSIELQIWRGPIAGGGSPTILFYFEESLDAQTWVLGPSTPEGYDPADPATGGDITLTKPQFFSYAFRLRWFRIRVEVTGTDPVVSCWAEGFLRDGVDGGAWTRGSRSVVGQLPSGSSAMGSHGPSVDSGGGTSGSESEARSAGPNPYEQASSDPLSSIRQSLK